MSRVCRGPADELDILRTKHVMPPNSVTKLNSTKQMSTYEHVRLCALSPACICAECAYPGLADVSADMDNW
jgi:hypothetical protein